MRKVFFDFETFYDAKAKYTLKHMTVQQYIRDPRFEVLGMSVAIDDGPVTWLEGHEACQRFFSALPVKGVLLIAHNASFDAAVAYRVFGYEAKEYCCTMFMTRYLISQGAIDHTSGTALKDIAPLVGDTKLNLDTALEEGTLDTYAIRDTEICRAFYEAYQSLIPAEEKQYIDMHVKMSAIPQFALDEDQLREVTAVDEKRKEMYPAVRKDETLIKALEDRGVTVQYKRMKSGRKPAFAKSDDFMQGLVRHADPVVRYLAELRLEAKSTCAVSKAQRFLDCGSPMACPLVFYAAATGRSGGTDNMNVQNMPRGSKVRTSLMAKPGKKLIIIDSSQIEVRTLGFLADDQSILDIFRRGGDIYREFAGNNLYNKKPEDVTKDERQIAKAAVLALGFGQGVQGFIAYAERMGIKITEAEAQHAVTIYRQSFPKITGGRAKRGGYWQSAWEQVLLNGYSVLPSGRKLMYPNMTREGEEIFYDRHNIFAKVKGRTKLWHGLAVENCLTPDTLVVTPTGLRPMGSIQPGEFVFDGKDFVPCGGYVCQGARRVIRKWGLTMTPDHRVLCGNKYKEFEHADRGTAERTAEKLVRNAKRGLEACGVLRVTSHSVQGEAEQAGVVLDCGVRKVRSKERGTRDVFLEGGHNKLQVLLREEKASEGGQLSRHLAEYDRPMHEPKPQGLEKLWRAWDYCVRPLVAVREFLQGCIPSVQAWLRHGPQRQQRGLLSRQRKVRYSGRELQQQTAFPTYIGQWRVDNRYRVYDPLQEEAEYSVLPYKSGEFSYQTVGDLLNCGPRHRFVVVAKDGTPYVVHNCVQATARDIIFAQVASVLNKYPEVDLCLMVHDESIFSVPEHMAQEVYEFADQAFKTPPAWAQGMPLNGEGHISDRYDK